MKQGRSTREIRPMMVLDLEDYSGLNDAQQEAVQQVTRELVFAAAQEAELVLDERSVQWSGDGLFALLPTGTCVADVAETFVETFDAAVAAHNSRRSTEGRNCVRYRIALHEGPVVPDAAMGVGGAHAVEVNRLANSQAGRIALRSCPRADLVVIASERVFNDYLSAGYNTLSPVEFRKVVLREKAREFIAYLYVPGHDLHGVHELDDYSPGNVPMHAATGSEPEQRSSVFSNTIHGGGNVVNQTTGPLNVGGITIRGTSHE
ncbi:hypothetical protein [Herbidospora yilanensis]|uniref:hypothetical protein n=1 Tax=Herbidospora yilanensis TaxID=354426 RepID=UPI00078459EE|nr:hypothetical protein [Herbidospora yilanensis]